MMGFASVADGARSAFAIEYPAATGIIPWSAKYHLSPSRGNKPSAAGVITLMEAFVPPEPGSFEQLMLPHLDAAYNLACWLLRDPHDAEDAVQDAFLRAHRALDRFRGADGRAWLLTIVRNVCYTRLREKRREPEAVAFEDDLHGSTHDPAEANAVEWSEVKGGLLRRALEQLPAEFREMIVLHEIEGMSYREIAGVAGIPMGTVMSRLFRARARLQSELLRPTGQDLP
jgi:RNA polymerase sigma-70 factor (ECF subfamily)